MCLSLASTRVLDSLIRTWFYPNLLLVRISIRVKSLDETRFRRYPTFSKAYPQKNVRIVDKLIIDLIMSIRVRFFFSTTPFCCGVLGALNWDIILCSFKKESNSLDAYPPPQSNQSALRYLPNCFSDSTLNSSNLSKALDFLCIR